MPSSDVSKFMQFTGK